MIETPEKREEKINLWSEVCGMAVTDGAMLMSQAQRWQQQQVICVHYYLQFRHDL